jgi:hypothetical protein
MPRIINNNAEMWSTGMKRLKKYVVPGGLLAIAFGAGFLTGHGTALEAQTKNRVFELRMATVANKEKLNVLMNRFRGGELKIWDKYGMKSVGFWVPTDAPKSETTLIYILAHESRKQADESWAKFTNSPEWKAFPKTPDLGPVTVDRTYMEPVDFSPIK